jgi:hypothetical protein
MKAAASNDATPACREEVNKAQLGYGRQNAHQSILLSCANKSRWNKCFATWDCSMTCAAEHRNCAVVVLFTKATAASVTYLSTWARTPSSAFRPIARPKGTLWTSGLLTTGCLSMKPRKPSRSSRTSALQPEVRRRRSRPCRSGQGPGQRQVLATSRPAKSSEICRSDPNREAVRTLPLWPQEPKQSRRLLTRLSVQR